MGDAYSSTGASHGDDYALCRSTLLELCAAPELSLDDWVAQLTQEPDKAQGFVDFLSKVLEDKNALSLSLTKRVQKTLLSITRAAQVFPTCYELKGVQCDLRGSPSNAGGFGAIYRGRYRGSSVCVKAVQQYERDSNVNIKLRTQATEFTIWAQLSHKNVVPFYGFYLPENYTVFPRICIVSPWVDNGNLKEYIQSFPDKPRMLLLSDVASGLKYLHESGIVHADIKANNILVATTGRAMITDFGISRIILTSIKSSTLVSTGTINWTAPELLINDGLNPTFKSDIWSFACLCFEVVTDEEPFEQFTPKIRLISAFLASNTLNPLDQASGNSRQKVFGAGMQHLLESCWNHDPTRRPSTEVTSSFFDDLHLPDRRPHIDDGDMISLEVKEARSNVKVNYEDIHRVLRRLNDSTSVQERLSWPQSQLGLAQEERDAATSLLRYYENKSTSNLFSGEYLSAFTVFASSKNTSLHRTAAMLLQDFISVNIKMSPIDRTVLDPVLTLFRSHDSVARTLSKNALELLLQTSQDWPLTIEFKGLEPLISSLSSPNLETQRSAIHYVAEMLSQEHNIPGAISAGVLVPLVKLVVSVDNDVQEDAIRAIISITSKNEQSRAAMVDAGSTTDLVNILDIHNTPIKTRNNCLQVLHNILLNERYRRRMLLSEPRLNQCLLSHIKFRDIGVQEKALTVLEELSNDGKFASIIQAGAFERLVPLMSSKSNNVQIKAIKCISILVSYAYDDDAKSLIAKSGILTPLTLLAQANNTQIQEAATGAFTDLTNKIALSRAGNDSACEVAIQVLVDLMRKANSFLIQIYCLQSLDNIAKNAPQLAPSTAHLLSFGFSVLYVGSIYVSSRARLSFDPNPTPRSTPVSNGHTSTELFEGSATASASSRGTATTMTTTTTTGPREKLRNERWRDDPDVIKARLVAVCMATTACCAIVYFILSNLSHPISSTSVELLWDLLLRLGFVSSNIGGIPSDENPSLLRSSWNVLRPHLITPLLFLGPLYATYLSNVLPGQKYWSWEMNVRRELFSWQGIRNVIAAPPTEELVFRGCTLSVLHLAGASRSQMIFLSPLSFGLAHVHHAWDVFNRYGRTSQAALRALTVTLFQLTYTTLFGCYTSYLFLRTSSIYPPISAHMFCNFMGFPRIGYEMQMFPRKKNWILTTYILGIIGFTFFLSSWTHTTDSFYWVNYVAGRTQNVY
ncbi:hypothetical protein NP233_g2778 [Leucocoprinus birnbaumii]|uniref:intramembrane prenyl-peptidase Rce1 n=1 Tax=Leucocoprinus birnbaumii TaxID=56174 RepID=A0AAD5W411_9AGAR|nr:hypothetical protein NP233_g2778 [Leucocoprinus birnbaumii]